MLRKNTLEIVTCQRTIKNSGDFYFWPLRSRWCALSAADTRRKTYCFVIAYTAKGGFNANLRIKVRRCQENSKIITKTKIKVQSENRIAPIWKSGKSQSMRKDYFNYTISTQQYRVLINLILKAISASKIKLYTTTKINWQVDAAENWFVLKRVKSSRLWSNLPE